MSITPTGAFTFRCTATIRAAATVTITIPATVTGFDGPLPRTYGAPKSKLAEAVWPSATVTGVLLLTPVRSCQASRV